MSKTVDERVVSMQFDNKHFERNVSTTMSTLDKLKQKLNLSGAAKGFDDVNAAAKKVNMAPLSNAVENVGLKFNAMYTIADQALRNITNSAMAAGKRIVSALTIDPVKTGFQEYETQINATQTILANTKSKGSTIDDVNQALKDLNDYADMTIYNFTEMTRNIGTFTAAGVDLDTSVNAIQGIANLAAVSGSTSQQASTAMYQLSQALSSGTVRLMDWNSVVNAGMGGEMFQNALKETSKLLGTGAEAAIKANGSFRESLSTGWLTSEVLTETLKKFTTSGANERVAEYTGLSKEAVEAALESAKAQYGEADAIEHASKALAKKSGKSADEIKKTLEFAQSATDAATKVKTFTQLWDVMKESAQSGWAQTWKIIIGDFEEAKALLTPLSDFFTNAINKISDVRNKILEKALGNPFAELAKRIATVTGATEGMASALKALKDPAEVVDSVIRGEWGNTHKRWNALTEAGYDWVEVQNLVNERLGCSLRRTSQYSNEQKKLNNTQATTIEQLLKLTDAELLNLGFTEKEIEAFRELERQSKLTGIPIEELIKDLDQLSGRNLLINSFKNIGQALLKVFSSIKGAWQDIFPPKSIDERAQSLYNFIASMHRFTKSLILSEDNAEKLRRTFKGLFAIIDIILTVVGGPIKIAFKILSQLLSVFNFNILDVTAFIGDAIVKFRDWLDSVLDFTGVFEKLKPHILSAVDAIKKWFKSIKDSKALDKFVGYLKVGAKAIKDWFVSFKDSKAFNTFIEYLKAGAKAVKDWVVSLKDTGVFKGFVDMLKKAGGAIKDWVKGLKEADNIPKYIIQGLVNGLKNGLESIGSIIGKLGTFIIDKIKGVLGIHSPSTVFMAIGGFIIAGLVLGLQNGSTEVWGTIKELGLKCIDTVKEFGLKCVDTIKSFDFKKIIATALGVGFIIAALKLTKAISNLASPWEALGDMFDNIGGYFKAKTWNERSKIILTFAISVAVLAAAVYLLAQLNVTQLWSAVGAIVALSVVIGTIAIVANKMDQTGNFSKIAIGLAAMGVSLFLLAVAMRQLSKIDADTIPTVLKLFAGMVVGIGLLVLALGKASSYSDDLSGVGNMLLKMSLAMLIMVAVVKIASKLDNNEVSRGLVVMAAIELLFMAVIAVAWMAGEHADKAGKMFSKMAFAMLTMIVVIKLASMLSPATISKGMAVVGAIELLFIAVIAVSKLAGEHAGKAGWMILGMSVAILMMVGVIALLGWMDPADVKNGIAVITALLACFAGLIVATKFSRQSDKLNKTLTLFIVAIGLMVAAVVGLSFIDPAKVWSGVGAITVLIGMFDSLMLMTKKTKNTKDSRKSLLTMLGIVVALAAIVVALSFIPNPDGAIKASAAVGVLMATLVGSILIMSKSGKISKTVSGKLWPLVGVIAALSLIVAGLSFIPNPANAIVAAVAVGALLTVLSANLAILGVVGKVSSSTMAQIGILTAVVAGLALVLGLMSTFNVANVMNNVVALGVLLTTMSANLLILSFVKATSAVALLALAGLTLITFGLAAILGYLSGFQIDNPIEIAGALVILLGGMSGVCLLLSALGPVAGPALIGAAAFMGVIAIIGGIAIALGALVDLIPQDKLEAWKVGLANFMDFIVILAGGLGEAVGAFIGGVAEGITSVLPTIGNSLTQFWNNAKPFFDGISSLDERAIAGVGILVAAVGALAVSSFINGILEFLPCCGGFSELGTSLTAFWNNAKPFFEGVKSLGADSVNSVKNLADAVMALTASNILEGVSRLLGQEHSLGAFGEQIGQLGPGVKSFADALAGIDDGAINKADVAAGIIKTLARAAKEIPAEGGWLQKICGEQNIESFGNKLASLGGTLSSFVNSLGDFGENEVKIAGYAAEAIGKMTEATKDIPAEGGWLQKITGNQDIEAFGAKLPKVGAYLTQFVSNLGTFGEDQVKTAEFGAKAIQAMSAVAQELPAEGGWLQAIVGSQDIGAFAAKLPDLGWNLSQFASNLGEFGSAQAERAGYAAQAISNMAKATEDIPSGNWFEKLIGTDESAGDMLYNFCRQLARAAPKLNAFSNDLGNFDGPKCITAVEAVFEMTKAASKLENAGLNGEEDFMVIFAEDIRKCGEKLSNFSWWIRDIDVNKMNTAINALVNASNIASIVSQKGISGVLIKFTEELRQSGEKLDNFAWWLNQGNFSADVVNKFISNIVKLADAASKVTAVNGSIVSFVEDIRQSGEKLNNFAWWINSTDFTKVSSYCSAITKLSSTASKVSSNGGSLVTFVEDVRQSGEKLNNFAWWIGSSDLSAVDSFIRALKKLGEVSLTSIATSFSGTVEEIRKVGETLVTKFIEGITKKYDDVTKAAKTLIDKFKEGLGDESKTKSATSAVGTLMSSCVSKIKEYYDKFGIAGKYVVSGFAAGITANTFKAKAKAAAMAQAALDAAKEELDEHSPSKAFYEVGEFAGLGFVNALGDYASNAYDASADMAKSARKGLSSSISKIAAMVDSDLDVQPTIRPVLDLSNVRSGANAIGGMLGGRNTLYVDTRGVGTISASMSALQNGRNDELVSAMKGLRKDISTMPRNNYSINGINFQEGDDVAEALKTIVRAAKVERRK